MIDLRYAVHAELTKIATVRSTAVTLTTALAVSVGIGVLAGTSFHGEREEGGGPFFDPLFAATYGLTLGQIALVVFAVLTVGREYSSGTIRTSLVSVPRRGVFFGAKLLAAAVAMTGAALVTVVATFLAAQAALGEYGISPTAPGAPSTMAGAVLYLLMIGLFAMGVTAMLRSSVAALGILVPILFLGSQGLGNVPRLKTVTQYLPDQLGAVAMHLSGPPDDPRWARDYGPWTGLALMALWTAASLLGGYLVLRRRDA